MKKLLQHTAFICALLLSTSNLLAQPTTSAPTPPTYDAGKVIAIYSDVNNAITGFNPNPGWGQATQYEAFKIGEDNILKYSNLNYQGVEFPDQNCAAMEYVHVDIFCDNDVTVKFFPINHNPQQEQDTALAVKGGQWNSFDVKLTDFTIQFNAIWQFKFEAIGNPTIYVDNIYFYTSTAVDTEAPTNVTAIVGNVTYNSVQLKLNATDNCGAVVYEISYDGGTATARGKSATELLYEVTGLQGSTDYTFSIVAKDLAGNAAEAVTATATTLVAPAVPTTAAPAPTVAADKVWSLYSDAYTSPTWFAPGWWNQQTVYSTMTIAGDNVMKFEKFNYMGLEIANNAPQDLSAYTHLHLDVWTPNAPDIIVVPISGGGETPISKELTAEAWNSIDIALNDFTINKANVYQLKFDGGDKSEIFYIDNIYFVNKDGVEDPEPDPEPDPNPTNNCSGDRGHFAPADAVKNIHYEIEYNNGDVLFTITSLTENDLDYAEIQMTDLGNHQMERKGKTATYTLSGRTKGEVISFLFIYSDTEFGGNYMTAENLNADNADVLKYTVGDCDVNQEPTDLENLSTELFDVYPVPATDVITLISKESIVYVDIFNVLGQLVYSSDNVETTINVSALTAGQYIVRAIDENGMIETVKFIKK